MLNTTFQQRYVENHIGQPVGSAVFLKDEQWEKLEPLLVGKEGDCGTNGRNNRLFIDAVLWLVAEQCAWHKIPASFGKWNTTYMRFKRWNESGVWRRLVEDLDDAPELQALMQTIAAYGDKKIGQLIRRADRKDQREIYNGLRRRGEGDHGFKNEEDKSILLNDDASKRDEDESTLHWVNLVSTPSRF